MVRSKRVTRWLASAAGVFAAWGMAASWAQAAQPPAAPPAGGDRLPTGTTSRAPATANRAAPAPSPRTTPPRTTPPPPPSSSGDAASASGGQSQPADEVAGPPVDLSNTWGYSRRGAPRPRYVRNTQDPIIFAPNPVGFYSGVSVQGNQLPPHPAKALDGKPAVMTWAGFERTAAGSRVFFQLSAEADYTVSQKDGVITIRMRKTKVNVRNNMRRLDLSYFKTPVKAVKVRRRGRDAVATVSLKRTAEPTIAYVESGNGSGYKLLVVSFTHGSSAVTAPARTNPTPAQ
ncbi:MAG: hypothetical protein AAGA54_34440 [Myxococcota bacterium]